jgi:hypothetical protein
MKQAQANRPTVRLWAMVGVFAAIVEFLVFKPFLGPGSGLPQWLGLLMGIVGVSGALVWIGVWMSFPSADSPRKWVAILNPGFVSLFGGVTVLFATFKFNVLVLISATAIFISWILSFAMRGRAKCSGS